jgi:ABC-type lipoprotein export system ATPase subunit
VVVSLRRACFSSGNRFRSIELRNINLTVRQGDIVFIMGSKGSGKSALLELIRY